MKLFFQVLALPLVSLISVQNPCECPPKFLGEDPSTGVGVSQLTPVAGYTMSGTASFVNKGSLPGHCNTGDQPCVVQNNCIFDFSVKVDITGVTPDAIKIGADVYDLVPGGTPGYFSVITPTERYDGLSCGEYRVSTIKVLDDNGTKMASAQLMLDCDPCQESL